MADPDGPRSIVHVVIVDACSRRVVFEAGKFGDVSKWNGVWLILLGLFSIVLFWVFARPALREHRAMKGGGPMGRVLVAGPMGVVLVVLGIVLVLVGH